MLVNLLRRDRFTVLGLRVSFSFLKPRNWKFVKKVDFFGLQSIEKSIFFKNGLNHSIVGEHNNNNSDLDLKGDDLEVSARRLSRKRALDLYDDVDEDLNYDDEIIDDDSMQNDDISATDMSSEKRNSYRHHEHDVDSSDDKDKNDDADGEYVRRHTMDGHQDLHPQEAKMRSTKKDSF